MMDSPRSTSPGVVMLLASLDGSLGGAQRQATLLARELRGRGLPVIVVNQSPRLRTLHATSGDEGVESVTLPRLDWAARTSFFLSFLVWAVLNRRRFDVIHAHSTSAGLTAGLVGGLIRRPVIVKVTGMRAVSALADGGAAWRLRRYVVDRTAAVLVAVSTEMMQALAKLRIPPGRRVLIPNGVRLGPLTRDTYAATKLRWLGHLDGPVVLYAGRLDEVKGVRRLLRMWQAMPRRDAATLLLVGDGPLRSELEGEVAALGLDRSVRFLGHQGDVTPFYLIADVFVLASRSEGLSNAVLEAMAAGLPVVASDVGGNRDVIEHGVSGFLVDWAAGNASAELVATLLEDRALRERVGAAALSRASRFSIAAVADQYCELYRRLVASNGSSGGRPIRRGVTTSSWSTTRA